MNNLNYILGLLLTLTSLQNAIAQSITKKQTSKHLDTMPSFSIHKDNYFIGGIPTNTAIDEATADVKYQISFKQMITKNTLPWNTYLFATYSQKAFWHIFKKSSPFKEINFNPTLELGKPIFKDSRLVGLATLGYNHNSNGRDGEESRSWNSINLSYSRALNDKTLLSGEAWAPFFYHTDNPDILDYEGLFKFKLDHEFSDRFNGQVQVQKGLSWGWKGVIRTRLYYRPFKTHNQYLMVEWYAGHAESLIAYDDFRSRVRIGYVIKTNELEFLKKSSKSK